MQDYSIYCTKEQTERAYKLGALISKVVENFNAIPTCYIDKSNTLYEIPTAEQMCGWLRAKGFRFYIAEYEDHIFWRASNNQDKRWYVFGDNKPKDYKESIIAAIDAALDFLEKQK